MNANRHPDTQARLDRIAELVDAMSPAERATAAQVFASVTATFAVHGHDDSIAGAQVLSQCIDLILIADREERRTTERQAL